MLCSNRLRSQVFSAGIRVANLGGNIDETN